MWWCSPVRGDKVHAEHDALLRVLSTVGGDHHHVAGYLREGALQTHGLQDKVKRRHEGRGRRTKQQREEVSAAFNKLNLRLFDTFKTIMIAI